MGKEGEWQWMEELKAEIERPRGEPRKPNAPEIVVEPEVSLRRRMERLRKPFKESD